MFARIRRNATSSLWQRYDAPWDGVGGTRGEAQLLGSIAVMYDSPHRHEITIYKVTVTERGLDQGGEPGDGEPPDADGAGVAQA